MVQSWIARTSLVIQHQQYIITNYMLGCAKRAKFGDAPNSHRTANSHDFDNALVAMPPLEV